MDQRLKILVIDDDVHLVDAMRIYLTRAGYEVFTAGNGLEGLACVSQLLPDLVLLDVMMPEMDGWQVCAGIREFTDVPIIMLTARGQEADKSRGLAVGANDYLIKPFRLRELVERIELVLPAHQS